MNSNRDLILRLLKEAQEPGDEIEPEALMETTSALSEPLPALLKNDISNRAYRAITTQFGYLNLDQCYDQHPPPEAIQRWAGLLRWLVRELQAWQAKHDPKDHKLAALFLLLLYWDTEGLFLAELDIDLAKNTHLIQKTEKLIGAFHTTFSPGKHARVVPIWEREAVEALALAEQRQDWPAISQSWRTFEAAIFPNWLLKQAIQLLYRFDFRALLRGLEACSQILLAFEIAAPLSAEQRLRLALESHNHYVEFACVFHTLRDRRRLTLAPDEQSLLTDILVKIAQDDENWSKWMRALNKYPIRHPALQAPLGRALAAMPQSKLQAYVDALSLDRDDSSRNEVAHCLAAFHHQASPEQAKILWAAAFRRWDQWNFEVRDNIDMIFDVATSTLDYAVVAYIIECLDEAERIEALNQLAEQIVNIPSTWYASAEGCQTAWHRLLSKMQPYAHALQGARSSDTWLQQEGRMYSPFDTSAESYLGMMFRVR